MHHNSYRFKNWDDSNRFELIPVSLNWLELIWIYSDDYIQSDSADSNPFIRFESVFRLIYSKSDWSSSESHRANPHLSVLLPLYRRWTFPIDMNSNFLFFKLNTLDCFRRRYKKNNPKLIETVFTFTYLYFILSIVHGDVHN